ncbi:MAG: indole-3-glycerol phosphate synthase TrpC [Ignavibacteria bacterium]
MSFLEKILQSKSQEVHDLRTQYTIDDYSDSFFFDQKPLSLIHELQHDKNLSLIAEIKKASPSKGILIENFDHIKIALTYFENKVNAISVLTDKDFFMGDIRYLEEIARIKTKPVLRKDFIIDVIQVYEAKAAGADAILLIAEALSRYHLKELSLVAEDIGLEVLVEVHSKEQLDKIDFRVNNLIGINNRNLETFEPDINTTVEIAKLLPENVVIVSESGISSKEHIDIIKKAGVHGVLAGEYFMRAENIRESLRQFRKWCSVEG